MNCLPSALRGRVAKIMAMLALATSASFAPGAHASMLTTPPGDNTSMLFRGSELVIGSSASVTQLTLSGAGTVSFALVDMSFPSTLGSLLFSINDGHESLGTLPGAGAMSVAISGPVTLYADVFATAKGAANIGLYNLQVSFTPTTPVPLPPAGAPLGIVLGLLGLYGGLSRPRTYACHTPHGVMAA